MSTSRQTQRLATKLLRRLPSGAAALGGLLFFAWLVLAPVGSPAWAAPQDPASAIAPAGVPPAAALTTSQGVQKALTPTTPGSISGGVDPARLLASAVGDDAPVPTSTAVRLLLFLTGLSFIPALVVVMTPFVRFVVVFSLLRQALGLQQSPPNQVIIGLSLFLTLTVMEPTIAASWSQGLSPFLDGQIQAGDALSATLGPLRDFMLANTRRADMATILDISGAGTPGTLADIPTASVASAYVLSELKTSFIVAVYIFVPFLVIDLVISSILLGMGMMMMPPVLVSLPVKLMVFVLMDGWGLLVRNLVAGISR